MSDSKQILNEEHVDFLKEMMNIGAGNASTALHKMLKHPVELKIPRVDILPITKVPSIFDNPSLPVVCVKMGIVGDVDGGAFFIVSEEHSVRLVNLIKKATVGLTPFKAHKPDEMGLSVLSEIGNIVTGVYLAAIHDFCRLNIYHTVPMLTIDMVQAVLDEILIKLDLNIEIATVIENEFIIGRYPINSILVLITSAESAGVLANSLEQARKAYVST